MIRLFVKRPAMTLMFVLVFVVLGAVSFSNLVIERTPKIDFPLVSIRTVYNGASPEEIETQIVKKIEDAISEISQIKKISSMAYENFGFIMIEFEIDADVNIKAIEVKDKIEPILNDLPQDALKPVVAKFDPTIDPIMDLILSSKTDDPRTLYEYADKILRDKLSVTEGVASVDVYGGQQRQINVELDNNLMKRFFLSIGAVTDAISGKNLNMPGGAVENRVSRSSVRMLGEFRNVDDIRSMNLVSYEGRQLKLSDVATVRDSYKKIETYTRYNGENVVGLSIKKLSDGDAVSIAKRIRKTLKELKASIPESMNLTIAYDSTINILDDTKSTIINIIYGVILTVIILFVFLGDWRVTIIAALVIPTSIISAFFPMDISGFSINFVTLLAVAVSLGTLIANALVIIESVDLHLSQGKKPVQAAVDGTTEAAVAVFASAGTNLVVFTPIALMGGIIGQFMKQFGLTVVYVTIFSILASFSLTPMLCALLLKPKRESELTSGRRPLLARIILFPQVVLKKVISEYKIVFEKLFRHPILTILACGLIFISMIFPLKYIGSEFFPSTDQDKIGVNIEMPQGTPLEVTRDTVEKVEKIVADVPEITSYLSYVGIDGSENGSLTLNLKPADQRQRSDLDIINELIADAALIPDAEISFSRGDRGPDNSDITINVYGDDYDKVINLADQMAGIMRDTGYFRSVESSYKMPKDEIRFIPDQERMIQYGVSNRQVGDIIRTAVQGDDSNVYREKGEEYDINVELAEDFKMTPEDIGQITVMSRDGLIAISELGQVVKTRGYSTIRRRDKKRVVQLSGNLSKSTAGQVSAVLDEKFRTEIDFGASYGYKHVGNAEFQQESGREILKAFILAVILTYMLLTAILDSFVYPFVIVSSVMTSFVGVFYLMFFLEHSINIGSMMALVMVVGLVVNNAILVLDYALRKMGQGMEIKEALWQGSSVKFRTVIMTSLAIVFGALPQLFDRSVAKASMSSVIIGGILASIFFTFTLIPVVFKEAVKFQNFITGSSKEKFKD